MAGPRKRKSRTSRAVAERIHHTGRSQIAVALAAGVIGGVAGSLASGWAQVFFESAPRRAEQAYLIARDTQERADNAVKDLEDEIDKTPKIAGFSLSQIDQSVEAPSP